VIELQTTFWEVRALCERMQELHRCSAD